MNVDLPNLKTCKSRGYSFYNQFSVTLKSNSHSDYWPLLDIPNLQNVELPSAFFFVDSKSISSKNWLIGLISFTDVSSILADLIL